MRHARLLSDLDISVVATEGGAVVSLLGELDASSADELLGVLRPLVLRGIAVQVDASCLEFVDSSGLSVFVDCLRCSRAVDSIFRLTDPTPAVMRLLELTALAEPLLGAPQPLPA